jgi:hypothetical protein
MVSEKAPEHGGELDLHASGDISAEALEAGKHVMELLAGDAVLARGRICATRYSQA